MNIRNPFSQKASASANSNQYAQIDNNYDPLDYPICGVWESSQVEVEDSSWLSLFKLIFGR